MAQQALREHGREVAAHTAAAQVEAAERPAVEQREERERPGLAQAAVAVQVERRDARAERTGEDPARTAAELQAPQAHLAVVVGRLRLQRRQKALQPSLCVRGGRPL